MSSSIRQSTIILRARAARSAYSRHPETNVFDYQVFSLYGMNTDQLVVWNSFLSGQLDAAGLTKGLQQITDKVRNDSSVKKIPVTK